MILIKLLFYRGETLGNFRSLYGGLNVPQLKKTHAKRPDSDNIVINSTTLTFLFILISCWRESEISLWQIFVVS